MATTLSTQATWAAPAKNQTSTNTIWTKVLTFIDGQANVKTQWFMISLIAQGVFFLPLPAFLSFYYGAPVYILFITLGLFFANIIAGMGGSGVRAIFSLFAISVLAHVVMTLIFIL